MSHLQVSRPINPTKRLVAREIPVAQISETTRAQMWTLFQGYYADVSEAQFIKDLSKKDAALVLFGTNDGRVKGFSTVVASHRKVANRNAIVIFSGDTIVDKAYWGQTALQAAFGRFAFKQKLSHPLTPVYWFLISKGYKTYLLLTRNVVEYWPRHDMPTPSDRAELIADLAQQFYPDAWRPALGVLQFAQCAGRLVEAVAPITPSLMREPEIRFFAQKNPGHLVGDELCCLGLMDMRTFSAFAMKIMKRTMAGLLPKREVRAFGFARKVVPLLTSNPFR